MKILDWDDTPCCELNTDENTIDCERCGLYCEACHPNIKTTRYVATVNVPGYLPENDDPAVFESTREAWQYLIGEVDQSWDNYPEDEGGACVQADTAMHNLDQSQTGTVYAPTPGYKGDHDLGLAYSVSEVER